jgi:hypothetical protein
MRKAAVLSVFILATAVVLMQKQVLSQPGQSLTDMQSQNLVQQSQMLQPQMQQQQMQQPQMQQQQMQQPQTQTQTQSQTPPQYPPMTNPYTQGGGSPPGAASTPSNSERGIIVDVNGNLKMLKPGEQLPIAPPAPKEAGSESDHDLESETPPKPGADSSNLAPSTEKAAAQ